MKSSSQLEHEIADHQERDRLKARVLRLLDKWQPILGVRVSEFRVKKMRAFGSLNVRDGRLWIGQSLATMSPADLEYVIVHELVHLLIGGEEGSGHDPRFYAILDKHLPSWRRRHNHLHSGDIVARKLPGMG